MLSERKRLGFFGGLVAEGAGFVDLGGQFLNPRHHPPLLRQRRQTEFRSRTCDLAIEAFFVDARAAAARANLLASIRGTEDTQPRNAGQRSVITLENGNSWTRNSSPSNFGDNARTHLPKHIQVAA